MIKGTIKMWRVQRGGGLQRKGKEKEGKGEVGGSERDNNINIHGKYYSKNNPDSKRVM